MEAHGFLKVNRTELIQFIIDAKTKMYKIREYRTEKSLTEYRIKYNIEMDTHNAKWWVKLFKQYSPHLKDNVETKKLVDRLNKNTCTQCYFYKSHFGQGIEQPMSDVLISALSLKNDGSMYVNAGSWAAIMRLVSWDMTTEASI